MTFNIADAIEQEEKKTQANETDLQRAVRMGSQMAKAAEEVARLEAELKEAKERYNAIAMNDLPVLLKELGLLSIELEDGAKIEVKEDVSCSITEARAAEAMIWLERNGYGALIKTEVKVQLPAGQIDKAHKLAEQLMKKFEGVSSKEVVHPATLKSFVKERLEAGTELPLELFGVHQYSIAKLKPPGGKNGSKKK